MEHHRDAASRAYALLLALLGAALVVLLPTLTGGSGESPAAVTVGVLGAVLVALLPTARRRLGGTPPSGGATPATAHDAWPTLRGRVVDPVHPVRPRAPGAV